MIVQTQPKINLKKYFSYWALSCNSIEINVTFNVALVQCLPKLTASKYRTSWSSSPPRWCVIYHHDKNLFASIDEAFMNKLMIYKAHTPNIPTHSLQGNEIRFPSMNSTGALSLPQYMGSFNTCLLNNLFNFEDSTLKIRNSKKFQKIL